MAFRQVHIWYLVNSTWSPVGHQVRFLTVMRSWWRSCGEGALFPPLSDEPGWVHPYLLALGCSVNVFRKVVTVRP